MPKKTLAKKIDKNTTFIASYSYLSKKDIENQKKMHKKCKKQIEKRISQFKKLAKLELQVATLKIALNQEIIDGLEKEIQND